MTAHKSVTLCWRFPSLYAHLPRHLSQTTAFSQRVPSEVMYFVFHRSPTAHRLYRSLNHSFLLRPQHKKDSPLSTTEYLLINPHQQCPNRHSHSNPLLSPSLTILQASLAHHLYLLDFRGHEARTMQATLNYISAELSMRQVEKLADAEEGAEAKRDITGKGEVSRKGKVRGGSNGRAERTKSA